MRFCLFLVLFLCAFSPPVLAAPLADLPQLIAVEAPKHGLDPADYAPKTGTAEEQANFAFRAFASDLAGLDLNDRGLGIILNSRDPMATLKALAPKTALYRALQNRLIELEKAPAPEYAEKINLGGRVLDPGKQNQAVPKLRLKLQKYGADIAVSSITYDEILLNAVKKFQVAHGLEPDGRIGGMTLELINRTPQEELVQVKANLARLRTIQAQQRPEKRVEVSIPRFTAFGIQGNEVVLSMKAIVGRYERQTVDFSTKIIGLRLNPTWTVPDTIKHEDMLQKLRHNQEKFNKLGVEIYAANGLKIDPKLIDWENVGRAEMARLRLWRPAGNDNPLGKYRVLMPNKHDIYLHDTNERSKFALANRALSSGCVRIEKPEAMAAFLIQGTKNWTMERVKSTLSRGKTYDILFDVDIPVYLDYVTSWLDTDGHLVTGLDVYKKDAVQLARMKTIATKRLLQAKTYASAPASEKTL